MSDMIAKVTEAIATEYERLAPYLLDGSIGTRVVLSTMAKAAIVTLRQPTPEMCVRACQVKLGGGDHLDTYRTMIDAALGEDSFQVPAPPKLVVGA